MIAITIEKQDVHVNGERWGRIPKTLPPEKFVFNMLVTLNPQGGKEFSVLKDGVDVTESYINKLRERMYDTELRNEMCKYLNLKP
jgi:hypothetical protein